MYCSCNGELTTLVHQACAKPIIPILVAGVLSCMAPEVPPQSTNYSEPTSTTTILDELEGFAK